MPAFMSDKAALMRARSHLGERSCAALLPVTPDSYRRSDQWRGRWERHLSEAYFRHIRLLSAQAAVGMGN